MKFYVDPTFTCMLHTKKDFDWISNTLYRRAIIHVIEIGFEHKITLYYFFLVMRLLKSANAEEFRKSQKRKWRKCDNAIAKKQYWNRSLAFALLHFASSSERQIAIGHIGTNTTCAKCTRMRQNRPVIKRTTQPSRASFVYMTC